MKHRVPPPTPRWLRLVALVLGVTLLLWLPIEDVSERTALIFAAVISAWWGLRFLVNPSSDRKKILLRHLLVGALVGLAVPPIAVMLMVFKNGLHAHGFPDFTPAQMQAVLSRAPLWAGGGLLIALGGALARLVFTD